MRYSNIDGIPILAYYKADLLWSSDILDKALEWIERAIRGGVVDPKAYVIKGTLMYHLYLESHDKKLAESILYCYDKALQDPRHARIVIRKGYLLDSLGEYEKALECYEQGLVIDPDNATLWAHKSFALCYVGRGEDAIDCCVKVLDLETDDPYPICIIAKTLSVLGRTDLALDAVNAALEFDPSHSLAKSLEKIFKESQKSKSESDSQTRDDTLDSV